MKRRISSLQTFFMKFVYPVIFVPLLAEVFTSWGSGPGSQSPLSWLTLVLVLAAIGFIYWDLFDIKRVRIDDQNLYVSNYLKEIVIPISEIEKVSDGKWYQARVVKIYLRSSTEFGDKIVFLPTALAFQFFMSHPVVGELNRLAEKQQRVLIK